MEFHVTDSTQNHYYPLIVAYKYETINIILIQTWNEMYEGTYLTAGSTQFNNIINLKLEISAKLGNTILYTWFTGKWCKRGCEKALCYSTFFQRAAGLTDTEMNDCAASIEVMYG